MRTHTHTLSPPFSMYIQCEITMFGSHLRWRVPVLAWNQTDYVPWKPPIIRRRLSATPTLPARLPLAAFPSSSPVICFSIHRRRPSTVLFFLPSPSPAQLSRRGFQANFCLYKHLLVPLSLSTIASQFRALSLTLRLLAVRLGSWTTEL